MWCFELCYFKTGGATSTLKYPKRVKMKPNGLGALPQKILKNWCSLLASESISGPPRAIGKRVADPLTVSGHICYQKGIWRLTVFIFTTKNSAYPLFESAHPAPENSQFLRAQTHPATPVPTALAVRHFVCRYSTITGASVIYAPTNGTAPTQRLFEIFALSSVITK